MLWHVPHRFYRCLTHNFTQNLPYKYNLNMGTPNYIYIGYGMLISLPNYHFSFVLLAISLCVT